MAVSFGIKRLLTGGRRRLVGLIAGEHTVRSAHIDRLYANNPDPWRLASSANTYEHDKYLDTMTQLPRAQYARAVEIGCSVGVLTAHLATRCDAVIGIDLSEVALEQARAHASGHPNATFARHQLPDDPPAGAFDLFVFSEVLYFFGLRDLKRVADWVVAAARPGADIVVVAYLGALQDYPLTGDRAVAVFLEALAPWTTPIVGERRAQYRIDVVRRTDAEA